MSRVLGPSNNLTVFEVATWFVRQPAAFFCCSWHLRALVETIRLRDFGSFLYVSRPAAVVVGEDDSELRGEPGLGWT